MKNAKFPELLIKELHFDVDESDLPSDFVGVVYYTLYTWDIQKASIFMRYYTTEDTMTVIAEDYGISKGRVSAIIQAGHTRLLEHKELLLKGLSGRTAQAMKGNENDIYNLGRETGIQLVNDGVGEQLCLCADTIAKFNTSCSTLLNTLSTAIYSAQTHIASLTGIPLSNGDFMGKSTGTFEDEIRSCGKFPARVAVPLYRADVYTVGELIALGIDKVKHINGIGHSRLLEIRDILVNEYGQPSEDWEIE